MVSGMSAGDPFEELRAQVMRVAVPQERALGEAEDRAPERAVDFGALQRAQLHAGFLDPAPLAPRLLALVRPEAVEKVIEVPVAAVVPLEPAIVPPQEPGLLERRLVLGGREIDVRARGAGLACRLEQQAGQPGADLRVGAARDQQPGPGHRRERHGGQQLRVIVEPGARVGLRPAPVEDELAPGMELQVLGDRADQPAIVVAQHEMTWQPAAVSADAARDSSSVSRKACRRNGLPDGSSASHSAAETSAILLYDLRLRTHGAAGRAGQCAPASSCSRYLSASRAAMQPVPADVTACR